MIMRGSRKENETQVWFRVYDWRGKKAPEVPAPEGDSRDAVKRVGKFLKTYLLSAIGLAPKSRRLLTAVRAARTLGMLAAAAP
jgi:hypothetical protein